MPNSSSEEGAAPTASAPFPADLLSWAGNRSGGVRRLFDDKSGRPGGAVIETGLVTRLKSWAAGFSDKKNVGPRIVLLVGGPGNGKTEAIEATLQQLDVALGCEGRLIERLSGVFRPTNGIAPRLVRVDTREFKIGDELRLNVVQDASAEVDGQSGARLLLNELMAAVKDDDTLYLCCVNRGVLDDALITAHDEGLEEAKTLLESVVQAVSLAPDAPSCWPLVDFQQVAVWPMDAESLTDRLKGGQDVPASSILTWALAEESWPASGACAAGSACPFCTSRKLLSGRKEIDALLRMLRWFELASGKRWAFRDLFSLSSYILAGAGTDQKGAGLDPCGWAKSRVLADDRAAAGGKPTRETSTAVFALVAAQYQHALFHRWDHGIAKALHQDLKDIGLTNDNTAMGLYYFLQSRSGGYVLAPIRLLLDVFVETLDPALSSPDTGVTLWGSGGEIKLGEFDKRFSRSVRDGLDYASTFRALSHNERRLFERLAVLDELLSSPGVRRKRPSAANRVQRLVRDVANRIFRRSIGARYALVPDLVTLEAYEKVVADADGQGHDLREIAHQVEDLLNKGNRFLVSLTTTFGQPLPPARGRALLAVGRQRVSVREVAVAGRPKPSLCFLDIEVGSTSQAVALTYDLFRAVRDLSSGLSQSSLPRSVLALLDTTRARMAGSIVRDPAVLDRPEILLGETTVINRYRGNFVSKRVGGPP